tara:strand:+ start:4392 stop:4874 length:483 start_codon:yes stop_codon:yes gene_type:complete
MKYNEAIQNGFTKIKQEIDSRRGKRVILKSDNDINIDELLKIVPQSEQNKVSLRLPSTTESKVNLIITLPCDGEIVVEGNWDLSQFNQFAKFSFNLLVPLEKYGLIESISKKEHIKWYDLNDKLADNIIANVEIVTQLTAEEIYADEKYFKDMVKLNFKI